MPSSLSLYSSAPKTKIIFQFLWGILEGRPNRARPSQPILKNCQNGTFLPVDGIWNFFWPNDFIWSAMKVPFCDFIQNVSQAPSMCIFRWINSIISISAHRKWPEMVVSASTNQVWTKITIGSYAHVFCHSESDTSSVSWNPRLIKNSHDLNRAENPSFWA